MKPWQFPICFLFAAGCANVDVQAPGRTILGKIDLSETGRSYEYAFIPPRGVLHAFTLFASGSEFRLPTNELHMPEMSKIPLSVEVSILNEARGDAIVRERLQSVDFQSTNWDGARASLWLKLTSSAVARLEESSQSGSELRLRITVLQPWNAPGMDSVAMHWLKYSPRA